MLFARLISEFGEYHNTSDYFRGVLVEMTGILIEVLLLSIAIPIILYFIRRVRTRPIRAMVDFYLLQIFHKVTRMFLHMASIDDIMPMLIEEQRQNPKFEIHSHTMYGNLQNILFVLKKTFAQGDTFRTEVEKLSLAQLKEFRDISDRCIEEIDRLAAMLVGLPNIQQELFEMRILVYPLRDLFEQVIEDIQKADKEPFRRNLHTFDVQRQAEQLTEVIGEIFTMRRKLIDSILMHQQWLTYASLFLSLPYVIIRRWTEIRICRLRRKPYQDFISPSPLPDMLKRWRHAQGLTVEQAAARLGMSQKKYYDYEQGYRRPPTATMDSIAPHLRETAVAYWGKSKTEQGTEGDAVNSAP